MRMCVVEVRMRAVGVRMCVVEVQMGVWNANGCDEMQMWMVEGR